jgi:hypothetical protein
MKQEPEGVSLRESSDFSPGRMSTRSLSREVGLIPPPSLASSLDKPTFNYFNFEGL